MRQRPSGLKKPANLSDWMHQRLDMYALAATAAGVSMLACSPHAEAKVIFANTWIPITPTTSITNIDLNGDGVVDFVLSNRWRRTTCSFACASFATMKVLPQGSGNAVWGTNSYASALGSGVSVGSKGELQPGNEFMGKESHFEESQSSSYRSYGPWRQTTNRYLGVKFIIQGEVHYGWVRVDVAAATSGIYAAVSGYAYETVQNQSILTGQKSGAAKRRNNEKPGSASIDAPAPALGSLGTLAMGALGLPSWRGQDVPRK